MPGLVFEEQQRATPRDPNRADVACFVGFVKRRAGTSILPAPGRAPADAPVYRWLQEMGWTQAGARLYGRTAPPARVLPEPIVPTQPPWTRDDATLDQLLDLPVPIQSWEAFDRLFEWDTRPLRDVVEGEGAAPLGPTYLGAAVRSFFAQGGRLCYVVRVGEPWRFDASVWERREAIARLLPGFPGVLSASAVDRSSWSGVGHLFGLPDVSFVCLPDLADAVAAERPPPEIPSPPAPAEELFVECAAPPPPPPRDGYGRQFAAPRAEESGYALWAQALRALAGLVQRSLREIQVVAAVPLPRAGTGTPGLAMAEENLLTWLEWNGWLAAPLDDLGGGAGIASAFVQLAWPWVRTLGSRDLPEELESPDALLVGVLARSALSRGSYRSVAGLPLAEVHDVEPGLRGADLELPEYGGTLIKRVSLLGPTARGMQVLSDVTTARDEAYRQANVNRLVSAIVRAARRLGEEVTFEASGPRLWESIRGALSSLMNGLWRAGALRGARAGDAFQVRCDRTTMSQRDLDEGRVITEISFDATLAIERIRVVLAMSQGVTTAQVRAA